MKKIIILMVSIIFIYQGSLWAADAKDASGKKLYETKCQMCHGANGKADVPAAASFNPRPQDFTDPAFWQKPKVDTLIENTIKKGKGSMPPVSMSAKEIKAVTDYMRRTFKPR